MLLFLNTRSQPFIRVAAISPSGTPIVTAHLPDVHATSIGSGRSKP